MARQSTMDAFLVASTSSRARQGIARSASSESTLSCITLNNDAPILSTDIDEPTAAMSSTPPTSLDTASQSSELKRDDQAATTPAPGGRSRRTRTSVPTYNETTLSRSTRPKPVASAGSPRRDLSGKTLITPGNEQLEQDDLVRDSINLLDLDWQVDAMPGDKMDIDNDKLPEPKVGRQTTLLKKATAAIDKGKTVLGKRTRDLVDASKNIGRRSSMRQREMNESPAIETPEPEAHPPAKKRRTTDVLPSQAEISQKADEIKTTQSTKMTKKIYLRQGLYVGQEQDFDARLNPTLKMKKKQKKGDVEEKPKEAPKKRKYNMLPLPMFAGKRTIDTGRDFKLPYDVYNQLPPGQRKPDDYRKIERNVFVGDAAELWKFNNSFKEQSTCSCGPMDGCADEHCFNVVTRFECNKDNCNLTPEQCQNRSFTKLKERMKTRNKYNMGIEVVKTEHKGHGVRSCRTFAKDQIIVEYTGEIITPEECDRRMHTTYKDNENFYLMSFEQGMFLDATRGNIARFVNHSCEPNCRMEKLYVDGKPRIALFANIDIMTGDELTYDYKFLDFSKTKKTVCHCGTPSCRGFLGKKPTDKEPKVAAKVVVQETKIAGTKRKLNEAIKKGVEEVKSKKRCLSADMSTIVKDLKSANQDRAARAASRADIGSTKSKRVLEKKLSEKVSKVTNSPTKKAPRKSLATPKAKTTEELVAVVEKKTTSTRKSLAKTTTTTTTTKNNVVSTIQGASAKTKGKTIKVVEEIWDVPDDD